MTTILSLSEWAFRLGCFAAVLVIMVALEARWPRRALTLGRGRRWPTNATFVGLGAVTVRVLAVVAEFVALPLVAVGAAVVAERHGFGIMHWLAVPGWLGVLLTVVVLDFAVWLQHYVSHVWTPLWRFHRVHHADRDIDASTALRFHPVEIALSMLYKVLWVLLLGAPIVGVVVFEVILNASAIFNHANWAMPLRADQVVRQVFVTPDMHRVHHSTRRAEHDTNFGFCLAIWDRIFGTYTAQPEDGHTGMRIGLDAYQSARPAELGWSLGLPFSDDKGEPAAHKQHLRPDTSTGDTGVSVTSAPKDARKQNDKA